MYRRHVLLQEPRFLEVQRPADARGTREREIDGPFLVQLHRRRRVGGRRGRPADHQEPRPDRWQGGRGQKRTDRAGRGRAVFFGRARGRPPVCGGPAAAVVGGGRVSRVRRLPLVAVVNGAVRTW